MTRGLTGFWTEIVRVAAHESGVKRAAGLGNARYGYCIVLHVKLGETGHGAGCGGGF